jgi:hypothetical protein
MKISSKVFQRLAIAFIVISFCLLAISLSNYLKDYPNINSELKTFGISLAILSMGFSAVAKRKKTKELKND